MAVARGVEEQADWAAWYRSTTGEEPNYSRLLAELASSREERRSILHSYIEPTEEDREAGRKVPTAGHKEIAALVRPGHIRVIVTTNFDRLMENALREAGVEPTVVASPDALRGAEPITHSSCYILKLHGDYKDSRILNTDEELSAYPRGYSTLLDRIFDEYGLIVCGWSGEWDRALRAAILRAPNRRYPVYWAARGEIGDGARGLIEQRRAPVIAIADADSFFAGLRQRVEALEQSRRQNPLSIDLLVNSTKRFLAKPEYRIQLDDLFSEEFGRLIERLDAPEFSSQGEWSPDEFRTRIVAYEAATEPLARMSGVLGRWGSNDELVRVIDLIRSLGAHANKLTSGLQAWTEIRSYPAVLIFTAFGLGLTFGQQWSNLHDLLSTNLPMRGSKPERLVESMFLQTWGGSDTKMWNSFYEFEEGKTAVKRSSFGRFLKMESIIF